MELLLRYNRPGPGRRLLEIIMVAPPAAQTAIAWAAVLLIVATPCLGVWALGVWALARGFLAW